MPLDNDWPVPSVTQWKHASLEVRRKQCEAIGLRVLEHRRRYAAMGAEDRAIDDLKTDLLVRYGYGGVPPYWAREEEDAAG